MMMWDLWKKGFDAWESTTARYVEEWLESPLVLGPSGTMLTGAMKAKAAGDQALASYWGSLGVATKRDQERVLHALNRIQAQLTDLEHRLDDKG
jgi:hypothetical protein